MCSHLLNSSNSARIYRHHLAFTSRLCHTFLLWPDWMLGNGHRTVCRSIKLKLGFLFLKVLLLKCAMSEKINTSMYYCGVPPLSLLSLSLALSLFKLQVWCVVSLKKKRNTSLIIRQHFYSKIWISFKLKITKDKNARITSKWLASKGLP